MLIVTPNLDERTLTVDPASLVEQDIDARELMCFTTRPFGRLAPWALLVYVDEELRVIRRLKVWCMGVPDLDGDELCNLARMSWRYAAREFERQLEKEQKDDGGSCTRPEASHYEVPRLPKVDDNRHIPVPERPDADRKVPVPKLQAAALHGYSRCDPYRHEGSGNGD